MDLTGPFDHFFQDRAEETVLLEQKRRRDEQKGRLFF